MIELTIYLIFYHFSSNFSSFYLAPELDLIWSSYSYRLLKSSSYLKTFSFAQY